MKQKKTTKIRRGALGLAAALLLTLLPAPSAQAVTIEANPTVRIGLFYGSTALSGANLLNQVGSGYRFGYLDSSLNFQQLGYTSETAISMVKTQNVYYGTVGGWSGYYDTASGAAVGCYHIQLPQTYGSFEEAKAAAGAYSGGFPAWIDGVYYVRIGAYTDLTAAQAAQTALGLTGTSIVTASGAGVSVVKTGTSELLFQFDSTTGLYLTVKPGLDDSVKTETIFRGNTYYGSFQYQRDGGDLTVVNVLSMDDYIQGVIVREMSASWPLEALKAQAVAARTYAYGKLLASNHQGSGFDLCNGTHCQAYAGIGDASATSIQAVEETSGEYLWYNGSLADQALYSASDGGATESAVNVWGNEYPYLIGKADPYEALVTSKISNYNWTVTFTAQELTDRLNAANYTNSGIVDFQVTKVSSTGNAIEITFTDSAGQRWTMSGDTCRTFLGLPSLRYTVSGGGGSTGYSVNGTGTLTTLNGAYAVDGSGSSAALTEGQVYVISGDGTTSLATASASTGSGSGVFTVTGSGNGHNVGMSQWGAYAMAQQGYTYLDILTFYYTGIEVRQP